MVSSAPLNTSVFTTAFDSWERGHVPCPPYEGPGGGVAVVGMTAGVKVGGFVVEVASSEKIAAS